MGKIMISDTTWCDRMDERTAWPPDVARFWPDEASLRATESVAGCPADGPCAPVDPPAPWWVHIDDAVIAVDKPAGLLAVPGRGEAGRDCLAARVQHWHADARVVHRLDMATSGLMLFARGAAMQRALGVAFERRRIDKRYVAIVGGCIEADTGSIDAPLRADWPNRPRQVVDRADGKPSLTLWRVLARGCGTTRLELQPVTGRSHQLRVHLQSIGHPIVGDGLYAPQSLREGAARLLLHASHLAFDHPAHGGRVELSNAPPF